MVHLELNIVYIYIYIYIYIQVQITEVTNYEQTKKKPLRLPVS